MALYGVLGYSIFIDLIYWNKKLYEQISLSKNSRYLYATIIIVLFIAIIKSIAHIFGSKNNGCIKYETEKYI